MTLDGLHDGPNGDANRETSLRRKRDRATAGRDPAELQMDLRFTSPVTGTRRSAALDARPEISIADAHEKAPAMRKRKQIDNGEAPIKQRNRDRQAGLHVRERQRRGHPMTRR